MSLIGLVRLGQEGKVKPRSGEFIYVRLGKVRLGLVRLKSFIFKEIMCNK
jgi:hypothetical protein